MVGIARSEFEEGRDGELRLMAWAALVGSIGIHLALYFLVQPFWPGPVGTPEPNQWMVMLDSPGAGAGDIAEPEPSGESGGAALLQTETGDEAVEQTAEPVVHTRSEQSPAPVESEFAVEEETEEQPEEPEQTPEPIEEVETAAASTNGVTDIPSPEDLANNLFVDALINRGNGGRGATGAGTGAGGGGDRGGGGECADPVVGTWRARRFDRGQQRHATFTIRVTHREGDRLQGNITLRAWSGGPLQTSPPRCTPQVWDHTVTMPARGRLSGTSFRFDALSHRRTTHCMDMGLWLYNLDHFTGNLRNGTLDLVNNDGGHEVNAPYRFQRISCL